MKKLYSLFLLLAGILCFTSCGDDDYTYTAPESLDITKADLYFNSGGGTGSIEIKSDGQLQAISSVNWCTVNVSGGAITAEVTENISIESRAGTITVTDGTLTSLVAVYQQGLAFTVDTSTLKMVSDNGENSTFITVNSSSSYTVTIPSYATSWLSYVEENGKVTFNLKANTGSPRAANVSIESGSKKTVIPIAQYELDDLMGIWTAEYLNFDGEPESQPVGIMLNDGVLNLILEGAFAFTCNYEDGFLKVANGTSLGSYSGYYLFCIVCSQDGYVSWNPVMTYTGKPAVTEDGTFYIQFGDDGSWNGRVIAGIGLGAFSDSTGTDFKGSFADYYNLVLHK